jgi:hypothetical protein
LGNVDEISLIIISGSRRLAFPSYLLTYPDNIESCFTREELPLSAYVVLNLANVKLIHEKQGVANGPSYGYSNLVISTDRTVNHFRFEF